MPIAASDVKTYLSGGSGNTDPNDSLGGARSTTEWTGGVLHDLFDKITGAENAASAVDYRCIYVRNEHATLTAEAVGIYISAQVSGGATLAIAIADEAINGTAETIADENTAPSGPTFSAPTTSETALSIGDLAPGDFRAVWLRRSAADSAALDDDGATLAIRFDTPE